MKIELSTRTDKRYVAIFQDDMRVHFGQKNGSTYIDHKDKQKREAYIARHSINEDWTDPKKAGTLSRYILWEKPTLEEAISAYRRRFKLYSK